MPDPTLMFPALEDAAVAAQTTVGRVGWLRKKLTRLFGPHD